MKKVALMLGLALAAMTPGIAQAAAEDVVVLGVPDGNLAAKALVARDYDAAARKLQAMWPDGANDAARLINLGNAYAGMGRMTAAREAYRSARFAPETTLALADGSEESSRAIAQRALNRLNPSYAMR
jgi:hypothetical protein